MHRNRDAPGASTHAPPGRPRWAIVDPSQYPPDPLLPRHRHELEVESAIPADIIAEEDIWSLPTSAALPVPSEAVRHPDPEKGKHFGTHPDLGPGIFFPFHGVDGRLFTYQYKADDPRPRKSDGKPLKYETPRGTRPALYIPRRVRKMLKDRSIPLRITEGNKKVLAVAGRGLCIIGLTGVDGWTVRLDELSVLLPDWGEIVLDGRLVLIEFDSDVMTKLSVQAALDRLRAFLESRGAVVIPVTLPHGPNGEKQGLDDFIAAGGDLVELEHAAMAAALVATARPKVRTDGASACDGTCPPSEALREQVREYKAADELVRRGPFSPDAAQVLKQLVTVAAAARSNGKEKVPLLREDVARLALGATGTTAEKAVSRALKAYKPYQDNPELLATLPYRLEWREAGRKTHIDLYPLTPQTPRTKAQDYVTLSRLPKDRRPAQRVKERDDGCPRCHSPEGVESRSIKRCLNDACGHTYHTRPVILGRKAPAPAEQAPTPLPLLVGALPGQIVPAKSSGTYAGQIVPANADLPTPIPVAFTSRADQEAAAGPHYRVVDSSPKDSLEESAPRCVWVGCREPAANGFTCAGHLGVPAVAGGSE